MAPTIVSQKRGAGTAQLTESENREAKKQTAQTKGPDDGKHPNCTATTTEDDSNTSSAVSLEGVTGMETALLGKILSFLTVNEESDLCMTCKFFWRQIEARRTVLPCIVRQERLPTKVAYVSWGDSNCEVSVEQRQPFRFLVRTNRKEKELKVLDVSLKLVNAAWNERHYQREDNVDSRGATEIYTEIRTMDGEKIFCFDEHSQCDEFYQYPLAWDYEDLRNVRLSLPCLAEVYRLIADGSVCHNLPSFEYMINQLPECFHEYFPNFDWDSDYRDRQTELEFAYRPAKTVQEWYAHCQASYETMEFVLDKLPWYKEGYWLDDNDSFEYYWDGNIWLEESTSSWGWACWRRVKGSSERGQLCIARLIKLSREEFREEEAKRDHHYPNYQPLPVSLQHALVVDFS